MMKILNKKFFYEREKNRKLYFCEQNSLKKIYFCWQQFPSHNFLLHFCFFFLFLFFIVCDCLEIKREIESNNNKA